MTATISQRLSGDASQLHRSSICRYRRTLTSRCRLVCKASHTIKDSETAVGQDNKKTCQSPMISGRRHILSLAALLAADVAVPKASVADDFRTMPSGLRYFDVKRGEGAEPEPGDTVVVHWAGYTKGYQGKRIDNTSARDEPYEYVLGKHQAINAFEEAVSDMRVGGIRRIEVPGDRPELSYPRDRSVRFTSDGPGAESGRLFTYRYGPQPAELGGQRALDFVLDNPTLQDFNRTLLFDIKLLAVRKPRK